MRTVGVLVLMLIMLSLLSDRASAQLAVSADKGSTAPAETAAPPPPETPRIAPSVEDVCRALEHNAAEYELPVEFFARVIWQESRFNARAVSTKGALGIAQFMPATAQFRGLADPLDPIEALKNSASYLHDLRVQFGNLGLAAAAYNAGPGRVSAWLANKTPLPGETRNYVAIVTGRPVDEWAAASPPKIAESAIPPGVPCAKLANLILPPKAEQQRDATNTPRTPRWGMQLTAGFTENQAWALYRPIAKRYGALIGTREPVVIARRNINFNNVLRYNIRIADDDKADLDKLCAKLMSAGGACVVLRND
jgi:Transglycosylase SLT domain